MTPENHTDALRELLDKGAEVKARQERPGRNLTDVAGRILIGIVFVTLLAIACWKWRGEYVRASAAVAKVFQLQADTLRITNRAIRAENTVLKKDAQLQATSAGADRLQAGLDKATRAVSQGVAAMTALQRKQAADAGVKATGTAQALPTTVGDSVTNGIVATLTGKVQVYEDSIPKLLEANAAKDVQISELKDANADLVEVLNGQNAAITSVRSNVQNAKAKASKGIVKQVFNQGKIKVLGEIDGQLGDLQKPKK